MAKRPTPANKLKIASAEAASAPTGKTLKDADYYRQRDFKGVLARINREGWLELKKLSAEIDMSIQDMVVSSLNNLLREHGKPPVVESRVFPKD